MGFCVIPDLGIAPASGLYDLVKDAQPPATKTVYKPQTRDCQGCGAPLAAFVKCEYCGRMA